MTNFHPLVSTMTQKYMTEEIVSIKFEGEALSKKSVPIYELASSLIAFQRIVNKAALYANDELEKGAHLPMKRREALALQIFTHKKGSDLWGLAPYLTDPALGPIWQNLIALGLGAVGSYITKRAFDRAKPPKHQNLIVNIYPEMKLFVDRIGNIGGIERIEITKTGSGAGVRLVISAETQKAVREIDQQLVPGSRREISGIVTQLFPQSFRLDIKDAPGHYVRVSMDETSFEKVRRLSVLTEREICFEGIPFYRLGDSSLVVHQFRAVRVILPRVAKNKKKNSAEKE